MKLIISSFLFETEIGGGASMVVNQLAQMLKQVNYEVVLLTTWAGNYTRTDYIDGLKIIRLPASNLYWIADKDRQPFHKKVLWQFADTWNPLTYRMAYRVFLNEEPDVFHSHKLRGLSPSIWNAASRAGVKKIVHTCHDFEAVSPEGLLAGRIGRLAKERNLVMWPYQSIRRYSSRLVNHLIAPSRFVLDLHKKLDFFPFAKTEIIPNTHGFTANELSYHDINPHFSSGKNGIRRFLYIGRLDKAKGIDLLCQVFSALADRNPDLLLRVAGWGPLDEFLREKYMRQENIRFMGPVFGDQKTQLFMDSDFLIAPSVAPESFGLVIAEAFSQGIPVIASRIGAFSEIVRDGETGFLVQPGSVEELSSVILKISTRKKEYAAMSENCLSKAKEFTIEKFLAAHLDIYEG
jgi:glycosyltransferase involved in cell wall biosynthesis